MDKREFSDRALNCRVRLYHTAVAVLGRSADAEDAVQDALLSAWRNLPSLRHPEYFETWLTRILINRCRDMLRQRAAHSTVELSEVREPSAEYEPPDPALYAALRRLDEKYRLPMVLHYVNDMQVSEVARALGTTVPTVKWRIHQGRSKLIELYREEGADT